jgi:hypothetical protein
MGVPVAIQTTEPSGRERFVDGGVVRYPRIPPGYGVGVFAKQKRKRRIQQVGMRRAASVMHQTYDGVQP